MSYLPVGSEEAQRHYAQACLDSTTAFVNAIPVFIASDREWAAKFEEAGVPTTLWRYDGMFHGFFSMSALLDKGREAVDDVTKALASAW